MRAIKTPFWSYVICVFDILKKNETWYRTDTGFTVKNNLARVLDIIVLNPFNKLIKIQNEFK